MKKRPRMYRRLAALWAAMILPLCPACLVAQRESLPPPTVEWLMSRYLVIRNALTRPALTPTVVVIGSHPWRDSSVVHANWLRSIGAVQCDTGCDVSSIRTPVLRITNIRLEPDSLGGTITAEFMPGGDLHVAWHETVQIREIFEISFRFSSLPDVWGSPSQYADLPELSLLHRWLEARHQIMRRTAWVVVCNNAIPTVRLNQYVMASRSDRRAEGVVDDPDCRIPIVAQSDSLHGTLLVDLTSHPDELWAVRSIARPHHPADWQERFTVLPDGSAELTLHDFMIRNID